MVNTNRPLLYNGDQVIMFTDAKQVKNFKGYADTPSMEAWYKDDPVKAHLGLQQMWGDKITRSQGIFPELLQTRSVIEVNGLDGKFTYDVPLYETEGVMTTKDMSHQRYPGIDSGEFKIVLSQKFEPGDVLSYDPEHGQQIKVTEHDVISYADDQHEHVVQLVDDDKESWFLASNLAKGITYVKLSHAIHGEYGTNFSGISGLKGAGKMRCEYQLGNLMGVESYVTAKADSRSFSGATIDTRDYINSLQREAERLGELAVIMDVDSRTRQTNPDTMRIGSTLQFLVFKELDKLTAQQLLFQRAATFKDTNGVTRLNEGLWHQLRRGRIIKYARPGGITKRHIQEAVEYVFRNSNLTPEERRIRFKAGSEAYKNVLDIFQDEVRAQLNNLGQQGLLGSDRILPSNPVSGDLMNLKLSPVRFTEVYLPGIGNVTIERDTNLDYSMMEGDRMAQGMHPHNKAHSTYSLLIYDVEDQANSNNEKLPEGTELIEGGNKDANIYLVKPKDMLMHWGYTNGRYSTHKSGDIVSSYKQLAQAYWAWNAVSIWVRDVSKFLMIELDRPAVTGLNY